MELRAKNMWQKRVSSPAATSKKSYWPSGWPPNRASDPGRAHPRHRRGHQGRRARLDEQAGGRRYGDFDDLVGAPRSTGNERPRPGDARGTDHGSFHPPGSYPRKESSRPPPNPSNEFEDVSVQTQTAPRSNVLIMLARFREVGLQPVHPHPDRRDQPAQPQFPNPGKLQRHPVEHFHPGHRLAGPDHRHVDQGHRPHR